MSTKFRYLLLSAVVLVISAMVWSIAAAQEGTAEPSPTTATEQAPIMITPEATADMNVINAEGHGFLGVALQDTDTGVTVEQVVDGSAAADAGLQVGDIITAINGQALTAAADAGSIIAALNPGDTVTIDFTRSGSAMSVMATLGAQSTQQAQPANPSQPQPRRGQTNMGFGFSYNPQDRKLDDHHAFGNQPAVYRRAASGRRDHRH